MNKRTICIVIAAVLAVGLVGWHAGTRWYLLRKVYRNQQARHRMTVVPTEIDLAALQVTQGATCNVGYAQFVIPDTSSLKLIRSARIPVKIRGGESDSLIFSLLPPGSFKASAVSASRLTFELAKLPEAHPLRKDLDSPGVTHLDLHIHLEQTTPEPFWKSLFSDRHLFTFNTRLLSLKGGIQDGSQSVHIYHTPETRGLIRVGKEQGDLRHAHVYIENKTGSQAVWMIAELPEGKDGDIMNILPAVLKTFRFIVKRLDSNDREEMLRNIRSRLPSVTLLPDAQMTISGLSGHYASSGPSMREESGRGLSGRDLYFFPDGTYFYIYWADIWPPTIDEKGNWKVDQGFVVLQKDGSLLEIPGPFNDNYLPIRLHGDRYRRVFLMGYEWDYPYFMKHADSVFDLLIHSVEREEVISENEGPDLKVRLIKETTYRSPPKPNAIVVQMKKMMKVPFRFITTVLVVIFSILVLLLRPQQPAWQRHLPFLFYGLIVREDGTLRKYTKAGILAWFLAILVFVWLWPHSDVMEKQRQEKIKANQASKVIDAEPIPDVPGSMVFIEGGSFQMGSEGSRFREKPVHEVVVSDFYMGKYEVTVGEFCAFVDATGYRTTAEQEGEAGLWTGTEWHEVKGACWRKPGLRQTDQHPVVCVSWYDAVEYCNWLSKKQGLRPCYRKKVNSWEWDQNADGYRLPTEAEWEYACRAGTGTKYWWGNEIDGRHCNFADKNSRSDYSDKNTDDGYQFTAPVSAGRRFENPWGLVHMSGNVWEWCQDWYGKDYYWESTDIDPAGPSSGSARVMRGGTWGFSAEFCRSADRYKLSFVCSKKNTYNNTIGFRVVLGAR